MYFGLDLRRRAAKGGPADRVQTAMDWAVGRYDDDNDDDDDYEEEGVEGKEILGSRTSSSDNVSGWLMQD